MNRIKFTLGFLLGVLFIVCCSTTDDSKFQVFCEVQEIKIITSDTYTINPEDCGKLLEFRNHTGTIIIVNENSLPEIGSKVDILNYQQGYLDIRNEGVGLISKEGERLKRGHATIQKIRELTYIHYGELWN